MVLPQVVASFPCQVAELALDQVKQSTEQKIGTGRYLGRHQLTQLRYMVLPRFFNLSHVIKSCDLKGQVM